MAKKFYTAKTDRVFKTILCNENNLSLMQEFLSRVLNKKVKIIEFLPNDLPVFSVEERVKIVDLLTIIDGEYVHVEMNSSNPPYLKNRNFVFFSTIYTQKTKRGKEYDIQTKFIHIDFTYGMGKIGKDYYEYYVQDKCGKKYIENFKIIEFNMDKIMEYWYNDNKQKVNKYKHLIMLDLTKKDLDILSKGDEMVMEYEMKLKELNERETFHSAMTYEEDQMLMHNTDKKLAYDEGMEKGKKEGIKNRNVEIAKNLLSLSTPIETISKATGLTEDIILSLKDERCK